MLPESLATIDVIRRGEDLDFWKVDKFINSQSFRCMSTKFPLSYYDQLVFILAPVERYLIDVIYTDSDFLLAIWDARYTESSRETGKWHAKVELSTEMKMTRSKVVFAAVLLGATDSPFPVISRAEIRLFWSVFRNWVTLHFLSLPLRMSERFVVMEELIAQYDRLAEFVRRKNDARTRENILETVQIVTGTAAENTAAIGIETTATSLGHAAAGVVLAVFVDIAVTASMLARAKVRKDRGKITERQYRREVYDRLFQTGCQFVAGTTGTIVGQIVVPVPFVGAAIGGFVGSFVGLGVSMGVSKIQRVIERAKRRKILMMIKN